MINYIINIKVKLPYKCEFGLYETVVFFFIYKKIKKISIVQDGYIIYTHIQYHHVPLILRHVRYGAREREWQDGGERKQTAATRRHTSITFHLWSVLHHNNKLFY